MRSCLHHSCTFLSHLRKPLPAKRGVPSLELRSSHKISVFIATNSINSRKNDSAVFPLYNSVPPYSVFNWAVFPVSRLITTQYPNWVFPLCFTEDNPLEQNLPSPSTEDNPGTSFWNNLFPHRIKLKIIKPITGDPRTRRDSPKFIWTPWGGGWAQETSAGIKAPDPRRVQAKDRNLLWFLHGHNNCGLKNYSQSKSWELCFIRWEFLGLQAQETASQVTLRELLQEGKGWGARLYRHFVTKGRQSGTSKDYC